MEISRKKSCEVEITRFSSFDIMKIIMNDRIFDAIIEDYKKELSLLAIAIGGSSAARSDDSMSDIDVYFFTENEVSPEKREEIVRKYASIYEIGDYFGPGDEFYSEALGRQIDAMFFDRNWFEEMFRNTWIRHYPSNGYTTAFLYTLKNFEIIYDPSGWLKKLRSELDSPYPDELKRNIIRRNLMLMKYKPFASYYEQTEKAVRRGDIVSVNHRTAAFLASYFDALFAINGLLHPGEKRLVQYAREHCRILPENFEQDINSLLSQSGTNLLKTMAEMSEKLKNIAEKY